MAHLTQRSFVSLNIAVLTISDTTLIASAGGVTAIAAPLTWPAATVPTAPCTRPKCSVMTGTDRAIGDWRPNLRQHPAPKPRYHP